MSILQCNSTELQNKKKAKPFTVSSNLIISILFLCHIRKRKRLAIFVLFLLNNVLEIRIHLSSQYFIKLKPDKYITYNMCVIGLYFLFHLYIIFFFSVSHLLFDFFFVLLSLLFERYTFVVFVFECVCVFFLICICIKMSIRYLKKRASRNRYLYRKKCQFFCFTFCFP